MSDTELIKDRLDIAEIVKEYVPLKQAGANFKGRCPFHQEKTPSFMVSADKQIWHCFGCSKGGDIFSFVQEVEGMTFPEALRLLADKAGVTLSRVQVDEVARSAKNRAMDILQFAADWYHRGLLKSPNAQSARDYLLSRGVTSDQMKVFQIGFVPDKWDLLYRALLAKGFDGNDILAAGLSISKSGGGTYDRFRGRIMFPIKNEHGSVVGFTGRVLVETEKSGGKYVNTPQTIVYDKSRVIYGLDLAKKEMRLQKFAVVVEGQMDVIACHRAKTMNVVASSGTAFTEKQLKLLKRYCNELRMAFDMDDAGIAAATRGLTTALALEFDVKVIVIPEGAGKDPDDCIAHNPALWSQSVKGAVPFMKFLIDTAVAKTSGQGIRARAMALQPALSLLKVMPNAIEQGYWIGVLSERLGVPSEDIREQMGKMKAVERAVLEDGRQQKKQDPRVARVRRLFALLIRYPATVHEMFTKLPSELFTGPINMVYTALNNYYSKNKPSSWKEGFDAIAKELGNESAQKIQSVYLLAESLELSSKEARNEAQILCKALRSGYIRRQRQKLISQMKTEESLGNTQRVSQLLEDLSKLQ